MTEERKAAWVDGALLVALSILFRLPPLLNANGLNADVAVVGLQGMHVLRGEVSPFLWGSGYQSSTDSVVAAVFFAVLGARPWVLIFSALALHVGLTLLAFGILRARLPERRSAVLLLSCTLVFTTAAVHSYAVNPPREASLTLAMAALYAASRVAASRRPWLPMAVSGVLAGVACYADPYAKLMYPAWMAFALGALVERRAARGESWAELGRLVGVACAAGVAGMVPDWLLRHSAGAANGPMGLELRVLGHNWELLTQTCGPWAVGLQIRAANAVMDYVPWEAPLWIRGVQWAGFAGYLGLCAVSLWVSLRRSTPWPLRTVGLVGAMMTVGTVASFLCSVMVMDQFSMRYLATLTLVAPFAMAPALAKLPRRWVMPALAAHLLATGIGGWVSFRPYVEGPVPVRSEAGRATEDFALGDLLRARGIRYATADYWASYRLTFLFREDVIVVPKNPGEDRYRPYRVAFDAAPRVAYVHDRFRSRETLADAEATAAHLGTIEDRTTLGPHTVFFVRR